VRKLSFREQQEWDQMESAVLAAERVLAECETAVERSAAAGHVSLTEACKALEEAHRSVDRLYARWQELEAKRG
jgi:ATP-binding cassette subfamily F protein uup